MATSLSFWSCLSFKLSQTNLFDNRIKRRKILLRIYQPIAWKQEIYIHPFYFPIRKILKENSQKPKWTKQNVVRRFWNEIAFKLRTTHIQTQTLFPPQTMKVIKFYFRLIVPILIEPLVFGKKRILISREIFCSLWKAKQIIARENQKILPSDSLQSFL